VRQPLVGQGLLIIKASRPHSGTSHSVGLLWMSDRLRQRTLLDNIKHSQEISINVLGRIRTRNPSKRAAIDPCLRSRGHRDWQVNYLPRGLKETREKKSGSRVFWKRFELGIPKIRSRSAAHRTSTSRQMSQDIQMRHLNRE